MQDRITIDTTAAGRAVTADDLNTLGQVASRADDRVLAELLRPGLFDGTSPAKGIIPYGIEANDTAFTTNLGRLLVPTGTRGISVSPFRAIVGVTANGQIGYADIRSAIHENSSTTTLAANSSGNPRWDLIYAAVILDGNVSGTRYLKDKTTKVVTAANVTTKIATTLEIRVAQGTPGVSPSLPSQPADGVVNANGGIEYYIPLAFIRVVNGATSFTSQDVREVATVLSLAAATGGVSAKPAEFQYLATGALSHTPWATSGNRPKTYMAPTVVGQTTRYIIFDFAAPSVVTGDIIDASVDWRYRLFEWRVWGLGTANKIAFDPGAISGATPVVPSALGMTDAANSLSGSGQSFVSEVLPGFAHVFRANNSLWASMAGGSQVDIRVDMTTGALSAGIVGSPGLLMIIRLTASGPFPYV